MIGFLAFSVSDLIDGLSLTPFLVDANIQIMMLSIRAAKIASIVLNGQHGSLYDSLYGVNWVTGAGT